MAEAAGYAGGAPQAAQPPATRLELLTRAAFFDRAVVVLSILFAAAAYFDAWTYVNTTSGRSFLEPWQDFALHLAWLLFTSFLVTVMLLNIRSGRPVTRALPAGYGWCMVGCVGFPAMVLLDRWTQLALGNEYGLSALFSPPRVGEIVSGGLMVTGPLRAAWHRHEQRAGLLTVVAAALLLAAITFATQFAHPFRDPRAGGLPPAGVFPWVSEDLGAASLLLQGVILTATFLLMLRRFALRFGSFTLIFLIDGVLVSALKEHWEMILVAGATGLSADLMNWRLRPGSARLLQLRAFAFLVPALFAAFFFLTIELTQGIWWPVPAWSGSILITGLGGLLVSYLAYTPGARVVPAQQAPPPRPAHWPEITASSVKEALEALAVPALLATSPLCRLPYLSADGGDPAAELADLLRDSARELSVSTDQRDAQAGHLIVEYYVKRSGTHEQIAERLHLSRPTYYHRQQRGCELIAARLDKLIPFTEGD